MCCAFFMCRKTTSGSNKAVSPPLCTPCAPVPRSHCTLASKCKHFRFAVDEPCCPRVINCAFDQTNSFQSYVCLMLVYSFSPRVHSIPRGSPILKKAHQDDVLFLLYGTIYGREPNRMVGVRRLLANACVMHRV